MYRYETHCHTSPASKCARVTPEETVRFYREQGYAGIFITNHYVGANIGCDRSLPYGEQAKFYFEDYHTAKAEGDRIGLQVLLGVEMTYGGTDILCYGLSEQWYLEHTDVVDRPMRERLEIMREAGAFLVQAHPFREAAYIDHIRLFPRNVDAVETCNANRSDGENHMTELYAEYYQLPGVAGSDNHAAGAWPRLGGVWFDEPLQDEADYGRRVLAGNYHVFCEDNPAAKG